MRDTDTHPCIHLDTHPGDRPGDRSGTGGRDDVVAAAEAATAALPWLDEGGAPRRAGLLEAIADRLDDDTDRLVSLAEEETHLGIPRLTGEVGRTTGQLRLFAGVVREGAYLEATIDHADPSAVPPRPDLRRLLVPLGPVAVFSASNFPFAFSVAGGDTASALAAGCPVVVKAHPAHPRLSQAVAGRVAEALAEAGAPEGVLRLVGGHETGRELVRVPQIKAVGFTGSLAGGRSLFDLASGRPEPIPFYGELGSLNPVLVTARAVEARGAAIAAGLVGSFTLGVGQFCTKPGLVLVPAGAGFEHHVARALQAAAPPTAPMLVPRIAENFHTGVQEAIERHGATVLAGGQGIGAENAAAAPVVLTVPARRLLDGDRALLEEHFGPATVLVAYAPEELDPVLDLLPGSLTVTVQAEDDEAGALAPMVGKLAALGGRLVWNGWPTGVAVTWSQHHGGPWPATTSALHTSVGATAIRRWLRPVAFQDLPDALLPPELQEANPGGIPRRVDGRALLG
jgi:NADP-dependent aldehyde dehydrogenase